MNRKRIGRNSGFTLIELGVTTVLLLLTIASANVFWRYVQRDYQFSYEQSQLADQASQFLRQIGSELRQTEIAMDGAYPLSILDDNQLCFYADIDNDGLVERRRYFVEGTVLKRGIVEPSGDPPIYNLNDEKISTIFETIDISRLPMFFYYNGNWPGDEENNPLGYWTRPLETRLIRVALPLLSEYGGGEFNYYSSVTIHIRNLKDNL
jgi:type II secretory pathway pseudopilin PulG